MSRSRDWRVAVRMIDIRQPLSALTDVAAYPMTRVFVRDGDVLIGSIDIANARCAISVTQLRYAIANGLAQALTRRCVEELLMPREPYSLPDSVPVSIVIPTCDRPQDLRRCLSALQRQTFRRVVEIIVVDNRPGSSSAAPDVVREFPGVRLLEEERRGLSYARNAGFAAATGEILVAIDDDVVVGNGWLERLIGPFERAEVAAVTGHVLPLELETESECRFEAYGGLGKGYQPFEVNGQWFRSIRGAVPTWQIGATANAAFRAAIFSDSRIGLLDEALGAGMPTGCSEDTYLFYKILKAGGTIVYEPSAWVWHRHRPDRRGLRQQIFAYSKGHVAYHLTTLERDRDVRALTRLFYSLPKVYLWRAYSRLRGWSDYPLSLIATEIAGNLAGPWALWRARRRVRRFGPSAPFRGKHHAVSMESSLTQTPAA
jgi:GT2 family glycosyltransferase